MNPIRPALIVLLSSCFGAHADVLRLTDGTVVTGQLAPPVEIVVKTPEGDRRVPFTLLPPDAQKLYWAPLEPAKVEAAAGAPVSDDEIAALANAVNLETWMQVASIGSFRDRPEKRGVGGLVVTKAFNALEENWLSVYSPKDPIGQAQDWNDPLARARALTARPLQFLQKRWIESFIRAAEAVALRDSNEFATAVREMKKAKLAGEPRPNFFTAK